MNNKMSCFKRETKPAVVARWSQGFKNAEWCKCSTCGSNSFIGLNRSKLCS